jgi:hypothetical protein
MNARHDLRECFALVETLNTEGYRGGMILNSQNRRLRSTLVPVSLFDGIWDRGSVLEMITIV